MDNIKNLFESLITMRDLAKVCKWEKVYESMLYHYPDQMKRLRSVKAYKALFYNIPTWKPWRKRKDPEEHIRVRACGEGYGETLQQLYDEDIYYSINTNKYSLSFRPWVELASLPIEPETLKRYTFDDIMAHFLWEITFYGNEKQMKKTHKVIIGRVKSIKKDTPKKK